MKLIVPWGNGRARIFSVEVKDRIQMIEILKRAQWLAFRLEGQQELEIAKKALELPLPNTLRREILEAIGREEEFIKEVISWFDFLSEVYKK